jgi:excinuclease UvrABC ATPase subunit
VVFGSIEVRGARENNLRGVSVDIPKRKLTVFTGVSGSGKSSLVFGTVAAESRRLIDETYSAFLQGFMPSRPRPDVDTLSNLSAAIVVDQEPMGANARSTVGTATDAYTMLRVIWSRLGQPHIGGSNLFSFNDPQGMCAECEGLGRVSAIDTEALVDRSKSLNEGAITFPNFGVGSWYWKVYADSGFFDVDKPLADYSETEWHDLMYGAERKIVAGGINVTYESLVPKITRLYLVKDVESMKGAMRAAVDRLATFTACPACGGTRLNDRARSSLVKGKHIGEAAAMQLTDLAELVRDLSDPQVQPILDGLGDLLATFEQIGLGYLSLDRESSSLSGGEAQRTKMVRHMGSALTDMTYVFDEPTIGLHPHDVRQMNALLQRLRDKGNTVLVVEHKPEVMAAADHLVDMGPGAGTHGGTVVYEGDIAGLRNSGTATGKHLDQAVTVKQTPRTPPVSSGSSTRPCTTCGTSRSTSRSACSSR